MSRRILLTTIIAATYIGTIIAANWAVNTYGLIPVWPLPLLLAPAGVYFAGLAFTLRDLLHETGGPITVYLAIIVGAGVSALVATPALALASAVAFTVSELADTFVYQPLRKRVWLTAVVLSNTVGLILDSVLFLMLAFGSLTFLPGQVVGKAWMTLAAVIVLAAGRSIYRRRATA